MKSEGLLEEITKYPYLTANCYSMDICFLETKVVGLDVDSWKLKKEKKIFDSVWSYKAVNWLSQIMRTGCILQFIS